MVSLKAFLEHFNHYIRNPLTVILNSTYMLEHHPKSPRLAEYYRSIEVSVQRIEALLNSILFVSEIENERWVATSISRFNFVTMLRYIPESIDFSRSSRPSLTLTLPKTLFMLEANYHHVNQALLALVENAIRYTPLTGTIKVRLAHDQEMCAVEILDDGIGIDTHDLPHIYEGFYRGQKAKILAPQGFGLGLTGAYHVVKHHHGLLHIQNQRVGTRVLMGLPLHFRSGVDITVEQLDYLLLNQDPTQVFIVSQWR